MRGRGCTSAGQDVEPYSVVELYPIAAHQWNFCCVLIELQPVRFNSGRNVTDYIWEDEPSPSLSSATDTYSWVWSALRHCFFFCISFSVKMTNASTLSSLSQLAASYI